MCPACMTSAITVIAAGAAGAGSSGWLVVKGLKKFRQHRAGGDRQPPESKSIRREKKP